MTSAIFLSDMALSDGAAAATSSEAVRGLQRILFGNPKAAQGDIYLCHAALHRKGEGVITHGGNLPRASDQCAARNMRRDVTRMMCTARCCIPMQGTTARPLGTNGRHQNQIQMSTPRPEHHLQALILVLQVSLYVIAATHPLSGV